MKKKSIFTLLAVLVVAAIGFVCQIGDKNHVLKASAEVWEGTELSDRYVLGSYIEIPSLSVKADGESIVATYSVIFPDKTAIDDKRVCLSQVGDYTVEYYATHKGKHYSVTKKFSVISGVYAVGNSGSSVEYGVYNDYGCTKSGVITNLVMNDTLTFANLIDVDELSAGNPFFEAYIVPEKRGEADFNKLIVTLTDALNPEVYLRYEINRYMQNTAQSLAIAWVSVGGNGQDQVGHELSGNKLHVNDNLGAAVDGVSFVAQRNSGGWDGAATDIVPDASVLSLAYDKATNSGRTGSQIIADMDDSADYSTLWNGFPSGKVRLSVSAAKYQNSYARFVVTKVLGTDLTDGEDGGAREFVDDEAPELTVDIDEMPLGQVNKHYAIPDAYAVDWYSGVCDVKTSVYYDYVSESKISIPIKNGEFIPPYTGNYVIEYVAKDHSGNEAKILKTVRVKEKLSDIEITLPIDRVETAEIGDYVSVEKPTFGGGSGMLVLKTFVSFEDEKYEIDGEFLPEISGIWTVSYVVTDYVGNEETASYDVNVTTSDKAKFTDAPKLPKILFDNCGATLPELYARVYASGKRVDKLASVEVIDANGSKSYESGSTFVPHVTNGGDKIKIRYYYESTSADILEIPVIKVKDGNNLLMQNYLYGNIVVDSVVDASLSGELGTAVDYDDGEYYLVNGLLVTAKENGNATWTFANQLFAEGLEASFSAITSLSVYDRMIVTLTDAESGEAVTVYITVQNGGAKMQCGDTTINAVDSLIRGSYTIGYSDKAFRFGSSKIEIAKADDGKQFEGFSSGKVYLSVTMENAVQGSGYIVNSINGAVLSYRNRDNSRPSVKLTDGLVGSKNLNDKLVIPKAIVSDVYAPSVISGLTVYAPDGTVATDINGKSIQNADIGVEHTLILSQYGEYTLSYSMSKGDFSSSNISPEKFVVKVIDNKAPTITVSGKVVSSVKKGEAIVLPTISVKDDRDAAEDINVLRYIVTSAGKFIAVADEYDSYIPAYIGKYQLLIVATDQAGNTSSVRYEINVAE